MKKLARHTRAVMLAALAIAVSDLSVHAATVLLHDDFIDNALNSSSWRTVLPGIPGTPGVSEQNQHIELVDRGYLVTAKQFDPLAVGPLTLSGIWTFNSAAISFQQEDVMQVFTRTDAITDGTPYGGLLNCIGFNVGMRQDNPGKMWIHYSHNGGVGNLAETPIAIYNGDSFQFTIRDDGTNLMFSVQQIGGPASATLTATLPILFASNYVAFCNGQRGANSVPKLSYLDDVTITTPCPRASIRFSEVEVCWPSISNSVYQVDYRSDLTTNTWVPLFTNILAVGQETCVTNKIIIGSPQKFYRVVCPTN